MITVVDQQSRNEADGSTLLTFTVRVPSRDQIGVPREAQIGVPQALHTTGGEIMETVLSRSDTDGEPLERDGVGYTAKGRQGKLINLYSGPAHWRGMSIKMVMAGKHSAR